MSARQDCQGGRCEQHPLHALRHFMASEAIADGFDVVTVSKRLGRGNPHSMTLKTYAHAIEQLRDRDLAQRGSEAEL